MKRKKIIQRELELIFDTVMLVLLVQLIPTSQDLACMHLDRLKNNIDEFTDLSQYAHTKRDKKKRRRRIEKIEGQRDQ